MNKDLLNTVRALAPIVTHAIKSGQIFSPQCELTDADLDILCEYDVEIPVSEGFCLTANVYRSKQAAQQDEPVPVIMCAHPYNNHHTPALGGTPLKGPPQQYRLIGQVGKPKFSKLTSWESPDPNFWVPAGYAVVNLNLPGYANSGGHPSVFSEHQGKCYYEAIEWVAKQPWCTGKIGLNGVSFLAITQYHVAACQAYGGPPPSLCCISPWEGLTDPYRDIFARGGLTELGFPAFWWNTEVKQSINGTQKDFVASEGDIPTNFVDSHPFYDDFWKEKAAKLEEITVPMLVCGSFSDHELHTMGSFRAFMKARSPHKWLYTHRTGKWDAYYSPDVQELTRCFMDCFLKGDTTNEFLETPPVRLEVRSSRDQIHEVRYENEWPIARTQYQTLYLNQRQSLSHDNPTTPQELTYVAIKGRLTFVYTFAEATELIGYMKLRLWVEARSEENHGQTPDDMGLYVAVSKLDRNKMPVPFYGSVGNKQDLVTRGWGRASRRELDPAASTDWNPVPLADKEQKLEPGEIVLMEIALYPSSTFFDSGEALQLIVSGQEIIPSPPYFKDVSFNRGIHVIHFGDKYDSHLLIPKT
ncbi:MAG: CocE/NonD family hydrolase [Cyanothece sp. SIO2G6]|nr:CocE/NonD family hydrolase [Cyanothece sp. SIO2G6]